MKTPTVFRNDSREGFQPVYYVEHIGSKYYNFVFSHREDMESHLENWGDHFLENIEFKAGELNELEYYQIFPLV